MNENDENVDPMRDAAPEIEHLRLEISENGEVFYRIDDVTLMMFIPGWSQKKTKPAERES